MIERYRDHFVSILFGDANKYVHWKQIEVAYLKARLAEGDSMIDGAMIDHVNLFRVPKADEVAFVEESTGHDVVAFLRVWTRNMSPAAQAQVHRGLTSSDLVENTLFLQLRSVTELIYGRLTTLSDTLMDLEDKYRLSPRVGRTHGQHAEPTTLGWRFRVWRWTIGALRHQAQHLTTELDVFKTPGAVGNMRLLGEGVALRVAHDQETALLPSTQVIPRQRMILWAGWMVAVASLVEEIALEIRLSSRTEVGEMMEGAARDRVGSSAMPHKNNPVGSERLSGLGRLVRSNFQAIAETAGALHHERDISNSSVERVAVPDLSHLVAFMVAEVTEILKDLRLNEPVMNKRLHELWDTAKVQFRLQGLGLPYGEAQAEAALWARDKGWSYDRILQLVNHRRSDLKLSQLDVNEFLYAMNA